MFPKRHEGVFGRIGNMLGKNPTVVVGKGSAWRLQEL